jgi:hypothetical protein
VAAVLLVAIPLSCQQGLRRATDGTAAMVTETVTDHLRVLSTHHPLDIESGGIHQVRPWFAGRLDFAPGAATRLGTKPTTSEARMRKLGIRRQ